jgi:hypothetical protein
VAYTGNSVLSPERTNYGANTLPVTSGAAFPIRPQSAGKAVRHFTVMHHVMKKASTIWSKETGIDRDPADQVEVFRPDDQRERYLSIEEMKSLKIALDAKVYRVGTRDINRTFYRVRAIILIALTTICGWLKSSV